MANPIFNITVRNGLGVRVSGTEEERVFTGQAATKSAAISAAISAAQGAPYNYTRARVISVEQVQSAQGTATVLDF